MRGKLTYHVLLHAHGSHTAACQHGGTGEKRVKFVLKFSLVMSRKEGEKPGCFLDAIILCAQQKGQSRGKLKRACGLLKVWGLNKRDSEEHGIFLRFSSLLKQYIVKSHLCHAPLTGLRGQLRLLLLRNYRLRESARCKSLLKGIGGYASLYAVLSSKEGSGVPLCVIIGSP
jgi:hypothetical protein